MFSSPQSRRSLYVYALLVGVPLAGLAAVLRAGSGLRAPPSIAGEWRIEGPADAAGDGGARNLTISQSGRHVQVAVGGLRLRGRFTGDSLLAERRGAGGASFGSCVDAAEVRLRARVDAAARPRRLTGVLTAGAAGCAPVPLSATRAEGGR